ncbi:multidrug efflux MFS transporter [Rothia terrae]|uniref:DHA2 family efflux MFS transporter permease subunit n=1 Tax=Rothia terrae TaxID=396015 RepID=UPI0014474F60|nr:DHA2 family efflux MFS transporter permease subunit [Rothia terrae]NKZ35119.1 multidrug efflux MFS transporter [Rothia terrae]
MTENHSSPDTHKNPPTGALPAARLDRADFLLLAVMVVAAFVLILNETLLGVALPSIMADLHVSASLGQWSSTAFMLTMAVVTPASGFILSRFSIRQVFSGAMILFAIGTLVAALAPSFGFLLLGRVLQAGGTGVIMPLLMTTMLRLVPLQMRGKAMGIIGMVISAAPAMGPTVSGLILSVGSWRLLFWMVLPIGLIALLVGFKLAPATRDAGDSQKLDLLSVALSTIGFGSLVLGLSSFGGHSGHGGGSLPVNPWVAVIVAVIALVWFVLRQIKLQSTGTPFLDMRVFKAFPFTLTVLMSSVGMGVMLGTAILIPLYTANALGVDALTTGLLLLPGGIVMAVLSPFVGGLVDKFGARTLVVPGAIALSASVWMMSTFGVNTPLWFIVASHVLMSIALPFINTPMMTLGLGSLDASLYSFGSSALSAIQQVAGAAATALFVMLMGVGIASYGGGNTPEANAAGVHFALLIAAFVSLSAIVLAFLVPSGKTKGEAPMAH